MSYLENRTSRDWQGLIKTRIKEYNFRLKILDDAIKVTNAEGNIVDYDILLNRKDVYSKVIAELEELVK